MNICLILAALLTLATITAHSVLGERLIFRLWRRNRRINYTAEQGIIWASWHVLSLFGLGFAALLYAFAGEILIMTSAIKTSIVTIALGSSALIGLGTRWRHPAWFVFILLSLLIALS